MEPTTSNSSILLWLAGFFLAAWNSLLTLILGQQFTQIGALKKELKDVSTEREAHCIPRLECQRTHVVLDDQFKDFRAEVRSGISGIHKKLDKLFEKQQGDGCGEK